MARKNPHYKRQRKNGEKWEKVSCITCGGSGKRGDKPCGLCNGRGYIWALK